MSWNLINDAIEKLEYVELYGDREVYRETAKRAIIAIEALIKENERLKNMNGEN